MGATTPTFRCNKCDTPFYTPYKGGCPVCRAQSYAPPPEPKRNPRAKRKKGPSQTLPLRQRVYERDGYVCVRCGSCADLTLDHIVPTSKGGAHDMDNLQTMCRFCNADKGDRISQRYIP